MLNPIGLSQIGYGIPQHRLPPKDKPLKKQSFLENDILQPEKVSTNYNTIIQSYPGDYHSGFEVRPYDSKLYEDQVKKQLISSFVKLYDKQGKQYLPQDEKDKEFTTFLKSLTSIKGHLVKEADSEAKKLLGLGEPSLTEHGVGVVKPDDVVAPEAIGAEEAEEAEEAVSITDGRAKLTDEQLERYQALTKKQRYDFRQRFGYDKESGTFKTSYSRKGENITINRLLDEFESGTKTLADLMA